MPNFLVEVSNQPNLLKLLKWHKTMQHLLGYSVDHINNFLTHLSIKGMTRLKQYCIKQSYAITPELLL